MKRQILLGIAALAISTASQAQLQFGSSMTFGAGLGLFHGDIDHEKLLPKPNNESEYQPSLSFWINQDLGSGVELDLGLGGARLQGTHEDRDVGDNYTPGAYFNSWIWEGGARVMVRPTAFFPASKLSTLNVGVYVQSGFMGYSSKIYRLADGQPYSGGEGKGPTAKGLDFMWSYGSFYRYPLNENMDMGIEFGLRNLMHDELDAYIGDSKSNDKYSFLQLTFTYTFMNNLQKEKKHQPGGPGVTGAPKQQNSKRRLKWTHQSPTK